MAQNIILQKRNSQAERAGFTLADSDDEEEAQLMQRQKSQVKKNLLATNFDLSAKRPPLKNVSHLRQEGDVPWLMQQSFRVQKTMSTRPMSPSGMPQISGIVNPLMNTAAFDDKHWNVVNGNLCEELALDDPINRRTIAVEFSSSSEHLVSATSDGLITLWDIGTGSKLDSMEVDSAADGKVISCVLSPCGTIIVAGTMLGKVLAWEIVSGGTCKLFMEEQVHKPRVLNRVKVGVAMVAISDDSQHIATAGHDGMATVWSISNDHSSATKIMDTKIDMPGSKLTGLLYIVFANNSRNVVTCGGNGSVLVMDINVLKSWKLSHPDILPDKEVMLCLSISKNSKWVAASGTEGNAYLWSLDEQKASQGKRFTICNTHMHTCVLDPDEIGGVPMRLVVGTDAGKLCMINLDAEKFGNQLGVIDTKAFGTRAVRHVSFSKDSRFILASGNGDHSLVFDADQMALLYKLEPEYDNSCHLSATFSPDSTKVAVGLDHSGQGSVIVWDIGSGAAVTVVNQHGHENEEQESNLPFATFTPENGKHLLRLAGNGHLQIWDTVNDKPTHTLVGMPPSEGTQHAVAVSPCGNYAAIETREEKLYAWNLSMASRTVFGDGHLEPCVEGLAIGRRAAEIKLSRGGQYFAALNPERKNDAVVGELSDEAKPGKMEWSGDVLNAMCFIGDGTLFAVCGDRPYVEIWKSSPKPEMCHRLEAITMPGGIPDSFINCHAHSEQGSASWVVAAVSTQGHLCIWQGEGEKGSTALNSGYFPGHVPETCKFSPDGSQVVTYGLDGTVALWPTEADPKAETPYNIARKESLFGVKVNDVAWSFDSSMIICCGDKGLSDEQESVYVYSVVDDYTIAELNGEPGMVFQQASCSPDNQLVALTRADGKVIVFTRAAARGMMVTDFSIWCNDDNTAMRTDEVLAAIMEYPQSANHTTIQGHNLFTACALMGDENTLEKVIDAMPPGIGIYSFTGLEDRTPRITLTEDTRDPVVPDALQMAIDAKDDGLIYDLLMGVAEGKATHRSANSVVSHWKELCETFPTMVLIFLSKLELEDTGLIKFQDTGDKLANSGFIVAGSKNYEEPDIHGFWRSFVYPKAEATNQTKRNAVAPSPSAPRRSSTNAFGDNEGVIPRAAVTKRVSIPFAVLPKEAGILKPLVESEVPPEAFGTPMIRAILTWKWEQFAGRAFAMECFYHLAQLLFFTSFAIMFSMEDKVECERGDEPGRDVWMSTRAREQPLVMAGLILEGFSLAIALRNLAKEIKQMIAAGSVMKYFSEAWNILDFISYTIIIFILPLNLMSYYFLRCKQGLWSVIGLNELIAIEVVFLWAELVHFAQGFRGTGALVRIIERTIVDIRWFMCLQVVLMIGFGTAFTVLFYGQNCDKPEIPGATCNPSYDNIFVSMVQMIGLVLGDIAVLDYYEGSSPRPAMTTILLIIYEFLVFVVLFNMLIAIMGETFVNVKEIEEVEYLRGRAEIICSIEDTMATKRLEDRKLFPKYLHTLELEEDWEVHEAMESMKGGSEGVPLRLKQMETGFNTQLEALHNEIHILKEEFANSIHSSQKAMKLYKKIKRAQANPPAAV